MYRYDEFDAAFVAARVEQFRDQVERRVVRRTDRGAVPAAPADERPLSATARLHAAHRRALRHAELAPVAQARRHRAQIRPRLRPFHHAAEPAVQLAGAEGHARHPGRARQRRDARDPDLGQLHPQRHRRPFRRRRRRRDRRSRAPMPRSCGNGRRCIRNSRSCRASSRSPSTAAPHDRAAIQAHDIGLQIVRDERGRARLRRLCRRRPRAHAVHRQEDPRLPARARPAAPTSTRSCASTISMAGATTSSRRASRSSSTRRARRRSARRSRRNSPPTRRAR